MDKPRKFRRNMCKVKRTLQMDSQASTAKLTKDVQPLKGSAIINMVINQVIEPDVVIKFKRCAQSKT